jgi:hypothetical protein
MDKIMNSKGSGERDFTDDEIARRRDKVIRRMANTPPQPKASPRPKSERRAAVDRVARKDREVRER